LESKLETINKKVIGQNVIINQLQEQLHNKNELSLKFEEQCEALLKEKSNLKHTIKELEKELSRIREEFYEESQSIKKKYEKRIIEQEESIKILSK